MNWNELPKEYKDLEKTFDENNTPTNSDNIVGRFCWYLTPQGQYFWSKCHKAKSIDELPPIQGEKKLVEKEKSFEVISFRSKISNKIAKLYPNGLYQENMFDNRGWTYELLINDKDTEIYQVRRLSDNIIFSITDETNYGVIKEFILSENGYNIIIHIGNDLIHLSYVYHKEYEMTIIECEIEDKVFIPTEKSRTMTDVEKIKESISSNTESNHPTDKIYIALEDWNNKRQEILDKYFEKTTETSPFSMSDEHEKELMQNLKKIHKPYNSSEGIKESEGKLNVEYDWDFLKGQMNRMSKNKDKYPKNNWKKPMDVEQLKDAMFRHTLEVMNDNFEDDGDAMGHLYAIALNAMMIFAQLNNGSKPDEK
jgi:hypothetical protein